MRFDDIWVDFSVVIGNLLTLTNSVHFLDLTSNFPSRALAAPSSDSFISYLDISFFVGFGDVDV